MSENNMSTHSKSRVMTLLAMAALIIGGVVFIWRHVENKKNAQATVVVAGAPSIQSVPGVGNPSTQYVQDQNVQNEMNEKNARKDATSAVPTITRSSFVGNPGEFSNDALLPNTDSHAAQCPLKKVVVMFKPNPESCTIENLKMARKTGVTAEELACQGCSTAALKLAGYTAGDLKGIGYTAKQLKNAGFTPDQLLAAGFNARDLKAAGFTDQDLKAAGFTPEQIAEMNRAAAQAGKVGLSAAALKKNGLNAAQLKKDGFSAAQLKAAGFSDADLKAAGFTPKEIQEVAKIAPGSAGLSAAELKQHGLTAEQLKKMGFSAAQLKAADFSPEDLKKAGFNAKALHDAGFGATALKAAGFTPEALKAAGFTAGQLKNAGVTPAELKDAGFTAHQLRAAGFTAAQLHSANFAPIDLRAAGFTRGDLLRGAYTPEEAGYAKKALAMVPANPSVNPVSSTPATANVDTSGGSDSLMPSMTANTPEARLAAVARLQQQQMNAQQRQDYITQQQGAMTMQAQKLLAGWSNHSNQTLANAPIVDTSKNITGGSSGIASAVAPIIKAGTVVFAVLDTGINSDQNSPILAHVVSGALNGSKLIGKFGRVNDRVILSFYLVNDPKYPSSIGINAVAIDPDTARTALAGSVDNHYLLRYGSLFASAFVQGMSDAVIANHSVTSCLLPGFGCSQAPTGNITTGGQAAIALGKVGQQFSNVAQDNFNTPPTVKVESGSGIGVLFMNDVSMPTAQMPVVADTSSAVKNQLISLTAGK
jgi:intracellular multiplication protein IcmE